MCVTALLYTLCCCRKKERCQVPKESTFVFYFMVHTPIQVSAKAKECANSEIARSLLDEILKGPLSCSSPVKTRGELCEIHDYYLLPFTSEEGVDTEHGKEGGDTGQGKEGGDTGQEKEGGDTGQGKEGGDTGQEKEGGDTEQGKEGGDTENDGVNEAMDMKDARPHPNEVRCKH